MFLYGYQNKQNLLRDTALTDCFFYDRDGVCFLRGTDYSFTYNLS